MVTQAELCTSKTRLASGKVGGNVSEANTATSENNYKTTILSKDVTLNRNKYIGGSDIAAILNMSRYKTPLKLWAEKTGKLPTPDLSNVEAVEMGTKLEQFVADMFTEKTGKAVRKSPVVYQHKEYPYMVAHIDRLVTGTDELLECKTCSVFKKDEWENDDIPQEYILQVMWYLGITGRKIGHIAVLIGGQSFKYKQIEFDEELFNTMVEAAKEFWQHVQNNTPVPVVAEDDETLKDLYSDHSEVMIELFPNDEKSAEATMNFEDVVANLQELKMHKENIEKDIKAEETKIKDIIKDNLGIKTPKYIVTWKAQSSTRLDTKALKSDEPEIAKKYETVTSYRIMRITKNKECEVA